MLYAIEIKRTEGGVVVTPLYKAHRGRVYPDRRKSSAVREVHEAMGELVSTLKATKDLRE